MKPLRPGQLIGMVIAVIGAVIITVTRPRDLGDWRSWALLLPLGGALLRAWCRRSSSSGSRSGRAPLWACLIGYIMSSSVVLAVQRIRKGSLVPEAPRSGRFWFAVTGTSAMA